MSALVVAGAAQASEASNFGVNTYALTADTNTSSFNWAGYNAQLQGGPFGVIALGSYGSQFLSAASGAGVGGSESGTASADTHLTTARDRATTHAGGASAAAFAKANLATGILRAAASGQLYGGPPQFDVGARTLAQFGDGLTFDIPGATASTVTDIGFTIRTDGTFGGDVGFDAETILAGLVVTQANVGSAQYWRGYGFTNAGPPTIDTDIQGGWVSQSFTGGPSDFTFSGEFAVQGAHPYVTFGQALMAVGSNGFADYSHTSRITLQLPSGVGFSSDSGVFLTGLGAVPEPGTWSIMLVGLGALGAAARLRRALA